ncbi:MAG: DUF615 domain-containing protein [Gammaproteobacteria bacterium]|nr:DUF615 domain-containing protein [Gammaproteobacteria bacterium]MCB1926188.1 DUF615 domain-containing protein [Gammaproteobacteria bacterium]
MSENDAAERPSKSAKKREIEGLQQLADQMSGLSDKELRRLGVDAQLRAAIDLVRPMKASGARNRQLKHCVKFMDGDELAPVRLYLQDRQSHQLAVNQAFHELEALRDRLIAGGDDAVQAAIEANPDRTFDRQQLRQLIRDAVRERESGKPAGSARKLFRYLRDVLGPQN